MTTISTPAVPGSMSLSLSEAGIGGSLLHDNMDESVPRSPFADSQEQTSRLSTPTRPEPLPVFVFPMKPTPYSASPRSAPPTFSRASGRRPKSAFELSSGPSDKIAESDRLSPKAQLPDFSFGSQHQSTPSSPQNIPTRAGGHKRGGSEFIGGDGKTGNGTGLMSTSPTKGDNVLPHPSAPSTLGPRAGGRGHAHRRSAAISCHDLSMILKPDTSLTKGGISAPTSPSTEDYNLAPFQASLGSAVHPSDHGKDMTVNLDDAPPARAFNRARVGFSDFVDIIPRPLSLVSSDSSSTVRQGHSVTGSMSSIISGGTSSPQSKEKRASSSLSLQQVESRPRTAEAFIGFNTSQTPEAPRRRNSIPLLMDVALAPNSAPVPTTPRSLKKWGFFGHESVSGESSPKSRPTSSASSERGVKTKNAESALTTPDMSTPDTTIPSTEPACAKRSTSLTRKSSKKPKKVRSWAGSILSRKSRQRSQKHKLSRRSPTPPLRSFGPTEDHQEDMMLEPESQTQQPLPSTPELQTDFASWKPRRISHQEESMSPIIDLDAALGPFNTPTSFGEDWENSQRSVGRKRAMHSAAGLGGFSGPGMHYHRRAESAPEFENPRFGVRRLGSNSTMGMEDVFEEENEDEEWEDTKASDKGSLSKGGDVGEDTGLGIDIKVVDSDGMQADKSLNFGDTSFERGIRRKSSGLSDGESRLVSSTKSEHSNRSLMDEPIMEEPSPIEIVDDSIPPRSESGSRSSDSTATPPLRPAAKDLTPVEVQPFKLQAPIASPASTFSPAQSSFPSPRSPFSYDAQRISTAPSSVAHDEEGFQSLLFGEPGPELRMSVDDVPSLTSSNSTMTRDSGFHTATNSLQFREGQRSASISSAAVSRKRSSMASLSRLISSSHGEKSKLSIETRPSTSQGVQKQDKTSRGKRISRMMQFWKPKES